MKISLNWLRDYVALEASVDELCRAITFLGFEVEQVIRTGAPQLSNVVVGEVLVRDRHPNADKLSVCQVDVGPAGGVKTIVCGAQNYKVGDRVPVALPGAVLPGDFAIKQSKIRGQLSDGMLCSAKEIGVAEDASGLLILDGRPALGTPINEVLPPGDVVFDIEITPNRPDCLCHLGIAREIAAWFKLPLVYPQEHFRGDPGNHARPDLLGNVRVDDPEDCPLYSAHLVTGVRIVPSPAWMQQRLTAVGLRPINNVVDVLNYIMLETGQPLHAFDAAKIRGSQIIVRAAVDGEKLVTLDGKERTLTSRMLVIADAERPLVIAGIMGGAESGVSTTTTDLIVESAIFRRQGIRWTSRKLGLSSDSSYRYERGVDPHGALEAAWRAIDLIRETGGGTPAGPVYRVGGEAPWRREIAVTPAFISERLGFEIPAAEMRASFEALELRVDREEMLANGQLQWTVTVPSWRDDLDRPIDLVEEVLRLFGTEKIPVARVVAPGLVGDDDPIVRFNRRATDYLVGHDFHECVSYTLRPGAQIATWVSQTALAELALANPFTDDQSHLRPTLTMGLLDILKLNQSRGVPATRLFEVGRIFIEREGRNFECCAVGFVLMEPSPERSWLPRAPVDFYTVKHHVIELAALAGIDLSRQSFGPVSGPYLGWQEGHSAAAGEMEHGWTARLGLVSLSLAKSLGLEGKVYSGVFALLPEKITAETTRRRYMDFSLQPTALRDLALVVDEKTPAGEVRKTLLQLARGATGNGFRVEKVEVFDVYRGPGLPEGKKSLAFSLAFRADDRTLTDEEVGTAFTKIQQALPATGYIVRQ